MPLRKTEPRNQHYALSQIKERGWFEANVTKLLGEPDATADNPHCRKAPPMRLYLRTRVEAAEATEAFRLAQEASAKRSKVAKAVSDKKREALKAETETMQVHVRVLPPDELLKAAIRNYNKIHEDRIASKNDGIDFLQRIQVNYVRHCLTKYDDVLDDLGGKVGVREATTIVRRLVYEAIGTAYPALKTECDRQYAERSNANYGAAPWQMPKL